MKYSYLSLFAFLFLFISLTACQQAASSEATTEAETVEGPEEGYDPEAKLKELGITLPSPPEITGKLGQDVTIEKGYEGARLTAINQLAVLKTMLGNLNRVKRIVKVLGMVNSDPNFVDQPKVINGFSDLMVEVFGDKGRHARAAVGMASLPRGQAVEIELVVEIYE